MAVPGPLVLGKGPFPRFNSGRHLMDGNDINQISAQVGSYQSALTATAGGGRANAYQIVAAYNQFSVVATGADSCLLPPSYPGLVITIQNDGANSMQVFASGSDTINGTAGSVGVALAAGASAEYVCIVPGQFKRFVSS